MGVAPRSKKVDWLKLAEGDRRLEDGMAALYDLFQKAPELGSLIDPKAATQGDLISAQWDELAAKLDLALAAKERVPSDAQDTEATSVALEARVTARGMVEASRILTRRYHLVMTNPPYLGAGQHGPVLKDFCEVNYKAAKSDLANVFLERCLRLCVVGGVVSFVMPQNWWFLTSYRIHRERLLNSYCWQLLVKLGGGAEAFDSGPGNITNICMVTVVNDRPNSQHQMVGLDASKVKNPEAKSEVLLSCSLIKVNQLGQLTNPDSSIGFEEFDSAKLFARVASCFQGTSTGDNYQFVRCFWEVELGDKFSLFQGHAEITELYSGRDSAVAWKSLQNFEGAAIRGESAWKKRGIAIGQMSNLPATLYEGDLFSNSNPVIIPANEADLAAIWCFCSNTEFANSLRAVNQKLSIDNGYVGKIEFDLEHWRKVAFQDFPHGLPKPYSDDPTQWIFHGHPQPATDPLQVAVARLLGYRWPAESDAARWNYRSEARAWIARCKDLDSLSGRRRHSLPARRAW
jgi:hypothetical protein